MLSHTHSGHDMSVYDLPLEYMNQQFLCNFISLSFILPASNFSSPSAKTMEHPKAKIEQGKLSFPKSFLNPDDYLYRKIFENDTQRTQHLEEAIDAGATLDRKIYLIRDKELLKIIGKGFEGINEIHKATKATIGVFADTDSNRHKHSYLELIGTVEEVGAAEALILANILKSYGPFEYPIILMPPIVYEDHLIIPVDKVAHVRGTNNTNILRMEIECGAWIRIEAVSEEQRVIKVFGPREHVRKAMRTIRAMTNEAQEEAIEAEEGEGWWREMLSLIRMCSGLWW